MYLTEHTSSPSGLSAACALKGESILHPFPSPSSPAVTRSALSWLEAAGTAFMPD